MYLNICLIICISSLFWHFERFVILKWRFLWKFMLAFLLFFHSKPNLLYKKYLLLLFLMATHIACVFCCICRVICKSFDIYLGARVYMFMCIHYCMQIFIFFPLILLYCTVIVNAVLLFLLLLLLLLLLLWYDAWESMFPCVM